MKRFLLLALCALFALNADARTIYVNAKRPNNNGNGLSPAKAKKTLQAAINIAKKGDTILVYPGSYAPIETNNKKIAIKSVKGQKKTKLVVSKTSVWSDFADLAKHVKKHNSQYDYDYTETVGNATVLSGFLFHGKGGHNGVTGGTVNFCTFKNFDAEGLAYKSNLFDCVFMGNYISTGSLLYDCKATRTKVTGNVSAGSTGSTTHLAGSTTFSNCLFAKNSLNGYFFDQCTFLNCTVSDNEIKVDVYGVDGAYSNPQFSYGSKFYNCILRNNYSQTTRHEWQAVAKTGKHDEWGYFDQDGTWVRDEDEEDQGYWDADDDWVEYDYQRRTVDGPYTVDTYVEIKDPKKLHNADAGNTYKNTDTTNKDPKFVNAAKGNYKLKKGSYCINKGKLTKKQKKQVGAKDLAGKKRIKGKAIDRGCYER